MYIPFAFLGSTQNPVIFNYYQLVNCSSGNCDSGSNAVVGVFNGLGSINNRIVWDTVNKTCGTAVTASYNAAPLYFTNQNELNSNTYGSSLCAICISDHWDELLIPSGCVKYTVQTNTSESRTFEYTDCTGSVVTQSITPLPRFFGYQLSVCSTTKPKITPFPINSIGYDCSAICYPNKLATDGLTLLLVSSSYTASTGVWRDISGNCNDAQISSSNIPTNWSNILSASADGWLFNPNYSQSLLFPTTLNATPSSSFTIQMWISSSYVYQNGFDLFSKDSFVDGWDTIFEGFQGSNDPPRLIFRDNVGQDSRFQFRGSTNTLYTITVDTINGVATSYNDNGERLEVFNKTFNSFTASALPLRFGWNANTDGTFFSGSVKSLLIYNRVLSSDEVWYNYLNLSSSNYVEVPCSHSVQPLPIPPIPPPPFPLSGSVIIWNDTTSISSSVWLDKSGRNNNGLISGSTLILSGSLGYAFNGTDNYVTYPITLSGQPTTAYTLQYYGTLASESLSRDFFTKELYTTGWDTIYEPSSNRFVFRDTAPQDKRATFTPVFGTKQLITITTNTTTDLMQLYVNDSFITNFSAGAVGTFNSASVPLRFGFNVDGDATYWKGAVSDILLYNKVLSATEVSQSFAYLSQY
jgi:hypothetical protein